MSDDYLWDRSGAPDAEVERLEQLLGSLRGQPGPLAPRQRRPAAVRAPWIGRAIPLALAASLILLIYGSWATLRQPAAGSWVARVVTGTPTFAARQLVGDERIGLGELVETDGRSTVRLEARGVGEVEVGPGSRLRIVDARPDRQRLALERGRLTARIWAAPGLFAVETASATAIDLGCRYSLEVDEAGAGTLGVASGWVGLERDGREAFVPEGASCAIYPGRAPGVPRYDDASPAFTRALEVLDGVASGDRAAALRAVVTEARERDRLSLWHLVARLPRDQAGVVYDRLAAIVAPPPAASRERILAGDGAALDAWWDELGLGRVRLFRTYRAR